MKRILFLNLTAFSQTGGIERFNKCFLKALSELDEEHVTSSRSLSAYDTVAMPQYYNPAKYKGFNKNKRSFIFNSIIEAKNHDVIFLGHINLAIAGLIIKMLYPSKKVLLVTHGIDVWGELSVVKKRMLKVADRILSVSNFTRDKVITKHGIDGNKVTVFHNTIDPFFPIPNSVKRNDLLRKKYGIKSDDFVIYTLTRLANTEQYKGYDKVLEALGTIVTQYPALKYVIAGKYDIQEKARIDKLIDSYGLQGHVILTGFVDEKELVGHYQMADMYIMPSKKEGFGIVFIEALVCGVPVVAGNADGSVDALLNGKLGTLVNPDSVEEIREAIITRLNNDIRDDEEKLLNIKSETLHNFSFEKYKERLKAIVTAC